MILSFKSEKRFIHTTLKGGTDVNKAKWNPMVCKCTLRSGKSYLVLIFLFHFYLVIS